MAAAVRYDVKSEQRTKKFFLSNFISGTINLVLSHILQQTFASEKEISSLIQFCHSEYAETPNILYLELWPTLHWAIFQPCKKELSGHGTGTPTGRQAYQIYVNVLLERNTTAPGLHEGARLTLPHSNAQGWDRWVQRVSILFSTVQPE